MIVRVRFSTSEAQFLDRARPPKTSRRAYCQYLTLRSLANPTLSIQVGSTAVPGGRKIDVDFEITESDWDALMANRPGYLSNESWIRARLLSAAAETGTDPTLASDTGLASDTELTPDTGSELTPDTESELT
jgi:hypothetical protein